MADFDLTSLAEPSAPAAQAPSVPAARVDFDLTPLPDPNVPIWNISKDFAGTPGGAVTGILTPEKTRKETAEPGAGQMLGETVTAADFLWGIVSMPVAWTATAAETIAGRLRGEGRKQAGVSGRALGAGVGEMLSLRNLLKAAGMEEYYDKAMPAQAMNAFSSWLEKRGENIEANTDGAVTKEDYLNTVDTLMIGLMGRGAGAAQAVKARRLATGAAFREPQDPGARASYGPPVEPPVKSSGVAPGTVPGARPRIRYPEDVGAPPLPPEEPAAPEPGAKLVSGQDPHAYELGSKAPLPDERISLGEGLALMRTPAFARTTLENLRLQRFKVGGFTDPEFAKALAIGGAGALTAGYLWEQRDKLSPAIQVALDSLPGFIGTDDNGFQKWMGPAIGSVFLPALSRHKTTRLAESMRRRRFSPDAIWAKTRIFFSEGKPLLEVSSRESALDPTLPRIVGPEGTELVQPVRDLFGPSRLADILQYPALYKLRSRAANIPVRRELNPDIAGSYNRDTREMRLGVGPAKNVRKTAVHELQHYLDAEAGLSPGGAPEHFLPDDFKDRLAVANNIYRSIATTIETHIGEDVNRFTISSAVRKIAVGRPLYKYEARELGAIKNHSLFNKLIESMHEVEKLESIHREALKKYKALPGENRAVAAAVRADLTDAELAARPPWMDYTVPEIEQMKADGSRLAGVSAAVKEPGGNWHPDTVDILSGYLKENLASYAPMSERQGLITWADNAVRTWLNRYAGTKRDPLNDVQIPFREGTKRWEELVDAVFGSRKVRTLRENRAGFGTGRDRDDLASIPASADVWGAFELKQGPRGEFRPYTTAITSYLSHVGDYLRQSPEFARDPKRFDLVRAVKETARWDAENAKRAANETEKLLVRQRADREVSPVFREYPDGMYWQRLTKPGQFAREATVMGNSARGYEPDKGGRYYRAAVGEYRDAPVHSDWIPESEHGIPADRAARGESSGHPGYGLGGWEAIKRGNAKVYSLRDAKGESHVTVEVQDNFPYRQDGVDIGATNIPPPTIRQIEGKGNKAPLAKYLPAIQDFVRSQEWGDISPGALDRTKLLQHSEIGERTRYVTPKEAAAEGLGYVGSNTVRRGEGRRLDADGNLAQGPRGQQGGTTTDVAIGLGAASLGAVVGAKLYGQDSLRGAIYGAIAGGILGTSAGRSFLKHPMTKGDYLIGASATRLGELAGPALRRRYRDLHFRVFQRTARALDQIAPFAHAMRELPKTARNVADKALMNEDFDLARTIPEVAETFPPVQRLLNILEEQHKELGRFKEGVADFFPRLVKNLSGLKEAIGLELRTGLENVLVIAEANSIVEKGRPMSEVEQSIVINRYLHMPETISHLPGYAKGRKIREVTDFLLPFYHDTVETLVRYLSSSISDLEIARFFGRDLASKTRGGHQYTDIDTSIGNFIRRAMKEGDLKPENMEEVRGLLHSRFGPGEITMSPGLQDVRNISNTLLLSQWGSAANQVADSLVSIYHYGLVPALIGVAQTVRGTSPLTMREMGLINHIAAEMAGGRLSGTALRIGLKTATFTTVDWFGKQTSVNAAMIRNQWRARARNQFGLPDKGALKQLEQKWGAAYKEDFPQLRDDLQNNRVTDLVESLSFGELSDMQPISLAEMSQAFHDHPNGRILAQLKTWMQKQTDIVRRDAYSKMKSGNAKEFAEGLKNLTALATVYALAQVPGDIINDLINGREVDPFTTPKLVENILQNFGLNRYQTDRLASGDILQVVQDFITPPLQVFLDIGQMKPKGIAAIPMAGRVIYNRYFGGNERFEIATRRGLGASERAGTPLSLEARRYLRERYQENLRRQQEERAQ